jgi:hypothetical protein
MAGPAMTYALIGDSQADGLAAPLARLLPIDFSEPHVGWTTAAVFGDPLTRALASSASTVLVVTGGNDDPLNTTTFDNGVARARSFGKSLIVVGPVFALTSDAARHDRARVALGNAAQRNGLRFVDAYPLTRDLARTSNVHLGPGYPTYAQRLAAAVKGGSSGAGPIIAGALAVLVAWRLW